MRIALPLLTLALLPAVAGCVLKKNATTPQPVTPAPSALVVLLPDRGTATAGRAEVSNGQGRVELAEAQAGVTVAPGEGPKPMTMPREEVQRIFGDALASLPPKPQHFVLYFRFDSEELTDESRRLVQDVLTVVKQRADPEVIAIGHTDTTGAGATNVELGLRRAMAVRTLLVDAGLAASAVAMRSHGEGALLVQTADNVFEPRNRRVEITVR
jgi:outer membrane protein OmpA-like peptidoglycan-associated protein